MLMWSLFVFCPFASLVLAINKYDLKESKKIVYLFLILFGLTFVLGDKGYDSFEIAKELSNYPDISFRQFLSSFGDLYKNRNSMDIVQQCILFLVSRITLDHRLLFGVFAAIFGYFYLKSVNAMYDEYRKDRNINTLFFFIFFVFALNPISNINGFRFWTASWVFFWGTYNVIQNKQMKYILVSLLAILFHFSFIFPCLLLLAYLLLGNRNTLYFILLIMSFFLSDIVLTIFPQIGDILGEGFASKISGYTSESRFTIVEESRIYAQENFAWYMILPGIVNFYYFLFAIIYLYIKNKNVLTKKMQDIFSFTILLVAGVNFVSFVPSMGRFTILFYMFAVVFIILNLSQINTPQIKLLTVIGIVPFLLQLAVAMRLGLDVLNLWLFTLLPLPLIFNDLSVYQFFFK